MVAHTAGPAGTNAQTSTDDRPTADVRLYRIPEAARILSMSRTVIYEQMRAGRLRSVQQGRARLVSAGAIRAYIDLLEREEATRPGGWGGRAEAP